MTVLTGFYCTKRTLTPFAAVSLNVYLLFTNQRVVLRFSYMSLSFFFFFFFSFKSVSYPGPLLFFDKQLKITGSSPKLSHAKTLRQLRRKGRNGSLRSERFPASSTKKLGLESETWGREGAKRLLHRLKKQTRGREKVARKKVEIGRNRMVLFSLFLIVFQFSPRCWRELLPAS